MSAQRKNLLYKRQPGYDFLHKVVKSFVYNQQPRLAVLQDKLDFTRRQPGVNGCQNSEVERS